MELGAEGMLDESKTDELQLADDPDAVPYTPSTLPN